MIIKTLTHRTLLLALIASSACSSGGNQPQQPAPDVLPAAPWQGAPVSAASVPAVYASEWDKAANKASCALVALTQTGQPGATPRAATFSGGWSVAYDLPNQRSAFGIAGTGVQAGGDNVYDAWPHERAWSDGSSAGYGPEGGGAGPKQLAYLQIAGQSCLYNVWSNISVQHLETLMEGIRFVR